MAEDKVVVEVIGVEPPCPKCKKTLEIVNEAVEELGVKDRVSVVKLDVSSPDVIAKYGMLMSPSLAVNGVVKVLGRVPSKEEVLRILREALGK